jgi:ATP phosphoribosyltransferase
VGLDHLLARISGVMVARDYVLIDYDIEEALLPKAVALTPGLDSPTVSPLAKQGWVAVRALVSRKNTQTLMDSLWDAGARAILVTELSACRL